MPTIESQFFIDVILPLPLERNFTYAITTTEAGFIKPGVRVAVPFGKTKIYTGIVLEIHRIPPTAYEVKSIHSILDENPIIHPLQFTFWQWIANYYMCTIGEVMNAALPSTFLLQSETQIAINPNYHFDEKTLTDDQFLVLEALQSQAVLKVEEIQAILEKKNILPIIKPLIDRNVLTTTQNLIEKYKPKTQRCVRLLSPYNSSGGLELLSKKLQKANKLKHIVLQYFSMLNSVKNITVSDLKTQSQASTSQIKTLIDKGIFESYDIEVNRVNYESISTNIEVILSEDQSLALNEINLAFEHYDVCLFHGITSSGKTEIYVKQIETILEKKCQALFLVPEIALTSQLVFRLKQYFGSKILVYHSRFSPSERIEIWNQMLQNTSEGKIIIGARSSVFLPFSKLKLIIVDEEHEPSYKQFEPSPRYHARDSAIVLGQMHNAKIILGSATPSVESYYNATIQKKFAYVSLNKRYKNIVLPDIELVDLKDKYKRKRMIGHFSDRMISEIETALEINHQVILFQNRRGYAPVVSCNTCGHTPECSNCDVSLTYHQHSNQLRCHYCGYNLLMKNNCSACGGIDLDSKGFGTEQIHEEVQRLFPKANVARMDFDTTRGKNSYNNIIERFENRQIDILVGTQMLTKGLDFKFVKLVGVLNADQLINFPDFRAHERSFQLLQQVSGRAGRSSVRGKVLIQSFNPSHNILQQVSTNNYKLMFEEQLYQRRIYNYPPFFRLIKITIKHKNFNLINDSANWLKNAFTQVFGTMVLGPEFPPIPRVRNLYHKNILIKIPPKQSLKKTKALIQKIKGSFGSTKAYRSVRLIVNVDNY